MAANAEAIREQIRQGRPVWGTFLVEFEAAGIVHILAGSGLDFILIDAEHGTYSLEQTRRLLDAANAAGVAALVRVPLNQRGTVTKLLDAGAQGIIFPQVRTMEEVGEAVEMTKYPPLGTRGLHLFRPHTGFAAPEDAPAYLRQANRSLITAVQIETPEAVELADEMAATEGVDMLYVGPGDLATLLGVTGGDSQARLAEAFERVGQVCVRHGKIAGTHLFELESAARRFPQGFRFFGYSAASRLFRIAMEELVNRARQVIPKK